MTEQEEENSYFSDEMRELCISSTADAAEPGYAGVVAHENKRTNGWKTCSDQYCGVHQPPTGIIRESHVNINDGGEGVK